MQYLSWNFVKKRLNFNENSCQKIKKNVEYYNNAQIKALKHLF